MTIDATAVLDHGPSEFYASALSAADVDTLYREAWTVAADTHGDALSVPRPVRNGLMEDHRRAHVAILSRLPKDRAYNPNRKPPVERTSRVADKGTEIEMTCEGPCGQTMTERKFPTLAKGGRGTTCRDCLAAARAAKKAGGA